MENKPEFEFKPTVTMELKEYERMVAALADERGRTTALAKTLENYSRFLRELDGNPKVIQMYMGKLENSEKIGSSFYAAFEEFVEMIKNDLAKVKE